MADSPLNKKALGHIRILDLTRVLAGPWCAQNLADLGADVIKIERPGAGDDTRHWGPPYLKDAQGNDTTEAAYYLAANRGKRSVTLDIATAEGQDIVRRLARESDVVLENYKVGQLKKYGLDYESLKVEKPDLVYCSITGFGQDGPYAQRAGYDFIIQGMGGFMSIAGERDDLPGGGPQKAGVAISDLMTGMYATIAVMAALAHRDRSGEGQYIDGYGAAGAQSDADDGNADDAGCAAAFAGRAYGGGVAGGAGDECRGSGWVEGAWGGVGLIGRILVR